jgi:bile acid-coenzyme A ligase
LHHEGSVGRGYRDTEIRILDDDGNDLPTGEIGHIFMRSPVYTGAVYLGEAPQLHMTEDGFGTVGDMGYVDADGPLLPTGAPTSGRRRTSSPRSSRSSTT